MNLEPLRRVVLAQVAAEAEQTAQAAEDARRERLAEARRQAAAIVGSARQAGEADARLEGARRVAAARRRARSLVLASRRKLYEQLRREALAATKELRNEPPYPALLQRLEARVRAELGTEAVVEIDPGGVGGLIGHREGKLVDYSLPVLVERCVAKLGPQIEELWR